MRPTPFDPARILLVLVLALSSATAFAAGEEPISLQVPTRSLDAVPAASFGPVDNGLLEAVYAEPEVGSKNRHAGPWRFAEPLDAFLTPGNSGAWESLEDGSRLWRVRVVSPGATSLNLGLRRFDVPEGARLWLYDRGGELIQGPYVRSDRTPEGGLWTALVPADEVVVELHLPAGSADADLVIHRVNHGFRPVGGGAARGDGPAAKQGACQNDVVCPEGAFRRWRRWEWWWRWRWQRQLHA